MYQLRDYVPSQRALGDLGIGALERWGIGAMGFLLSPNAPLLHFPNKLGHPTTSKDFLQLAYKKLNILTGCYEI